MQENLQAIYQIFHEVAHQKEALKEFKTDLEDRITELPSYKEYSETRQTLKRLSEQLKREASEDGNVAVAKENISKIRSDLRDLQDIMSLHLLRHYLDTGGEQLPVETHPEQSQEIVLKAKLGRTVTPEKR